MRTLANSSNIFPYAQTGAPPAPIVSTATGGGFYDNTNGDGKATAGDGDQLNSWMVDFSTLLAAGGQDRFNGGLLPAILALIQQGVAPLGGLQTFGTAGTFTFTVPASIYKVHVKMWGAGGGGGGSVTVNGSAAGGGQGGGYYENYLSVTPGQTIAVTVGASGAGGAANAASTGGAGGNTYFGSYAAQGGAGGTGSSSSSSLGAGGTAGGGGYGGPGIYLSGVPIGQGGYGGDTYFGGGLSPICFTTGASGVGPGGGGSGGAQGGAGGIGAAGYVAVSW